MGYLTDTDFEDLPEDDNDAFVYLESISRARLHESDTDNNGNYSYEDIMRYMNEITALAEEFDIPGINYIDEFDGYQNEYGRFTRKVETRSAQIRVRRARRARKNSVAISGKGRETIQHYLEKLKAEVEGADLPDKRKRALRDKIAEFELELAKKRFDLVRAMTLFALIATTAHEFTDTLIEAPKLVQLISGKLGAEKLEDDEQAKLLPAKEPFKAIPDMSPKKEAPASGWGTPGTSAFDSDLDDDVPF